ncbi:MAG: hypothetical protein KKE17_11625 [Proteobacteria bacterium]|nr:hypothetical protein [Pseudomonadota bacterium]MBU1710644.1 hypothetical protein [Pseudomonadota bacterium]
MAEQIPSCSGYCRKCGQEHTIAEGPARDYCLELMEVLEEKKRIDLTVPDAEANPHFSTDYLFGEARGQMFGILACRNQKGSKVNLKAFSGQFDGAWVVEGWAPPLFDVRQWHRISHDVEKEIKTLGKEIDRPDTDPARRANIVLQRRELSQQLMKDIHALYTLTNFHGESRPLKDVFIGQNGIPTGTGDCCAPKLFNHAARSGLIPLGLAEFYWGRENKSSSRLHRRFYPSCAGKCQPILGFLLCGLE